MWAYWYNGTLIIFYSCKIVHSVILINNNWSNSGNSTNFTVRSYRVTVDRCYTSPNKRKGQNGKAICHLTKLWNSVRDYDLYCRCPFYNLIGPIQRKAQMERRVLADRLVREWEKCERGSIRGVSEGKRESVNLWYSFRLWAWAESILNSWGALLWGCGRYLL